MKLHIYAFLLLVCAGSSLFSMMRTGHGKAEANLINAVEKGWLWAVKEALAEGASPDTRDKVDETVLAIAAHNTNEKNTAEKRREYYAIVRTLLESGANPEIQNKLGLKVLEAARDADGKTKDLIEAYLEHRRSGKTLVDLELVSAVTRGELEEVKTLIELGGAAADTVNSKGMPILALAADKIKPENPKRDTYIKIVQELIKNGADVKSAMEKLQHNQVALDILRPYRNIQGQKPMPILDKALIDAVNDADKNRVKELLEKGAKPNTRDAAGRPILALAADKVKPESPQRIDYSNIARQLINKGADVQDAIQNLPYNQIAIDMLRQMHKDYMQMQRQMQRQ